MTSVCFVGGEMMENRFMSLAPYQLAGCLRAFGLDVEIIEINTTNFDDPAIAEQLASSHVVGFSCNSFTYPFVLPTIKTLKRIASNVVVVIGGVHVLHCAEQAFTESPVDCVLLGEADFSFPALVQAVLKGQAIENIDGLVTRSDIRNVLPARASRAAQLPIAAYDLLAAVPPILVFETSRGCPFRCTFCSIDTGSAWQGWPPGEVVERFESSVTLLKNKAMRNVMFADDNFATDQRRAAGILRGLHEKHPTLALSFETRAREVLRNPIVFETCAELGIRSSFLFGIECGYDEGLLKVNKKLTVAEVRESASLCKRFKMQDGAVFSYIVGFPWETKKERMKTLYLADELFQEHGVKSTVFYWLPAPSPLARQYGVQVDYTVPYWWRATQVNMASMVDDEEADLMERVNANGNFADTRIDETSRPGYAADSKSPRNLPRHARHIGGEA